MQQSYRRLAEVFEVGRREYRQPKVAVSWTEPGLADHEHARTHLRKLRRDWPRAQNRGTIIARFPPPLYWCRSGESNTRSALLLGAHATFWCTHAAHGLDLFAVCGSLLRI